MLTRPGIDIHIPALLAAQLLVTFGLAEFSYRWIESPIRHQGFREGLRSWQATFKLWSIPQKVGVGTGIICAGLLLIWQTYLPVYEARPDSIPARQNTSLPANILSLTQTKSAFPNTQQSAAVSTSGYPTMTIQNDTQILQSTPSATLPSTLPGITLIGDSIMQGAAPMIEDVLARDIFIDAARKRRMEDVPALIEILAEEGQLGSNRPSEASVFDQVMESLLEHQVERIIFINVHRPIGWEYYVNKQFAEDIGR